VPNEITETTDLLVIGAGLAGLYAALEAADRGASVTMVTKGSPRVSNSFMAQGGIAAAVGPGDDPDQHAVDTLSAGRGLGDPAAVNVLVRDGVLRIRDLERYGVSFDRTPDGAYALGREGGHGRRRILHAGGSATGAAIAGTLIRRVGSHPRIRVIEHAAAIGLDADGDACGGAWVLGHDELRSIRARMTLLATGGAGALYARTTNPAGATGDGIALAARAGAAAIDMEFVQFHPTALAVGDRAFLISEAVRGEGAHLVDGDGRRFMPDEHADAELAPRDVVATVLQRRLEAGQASFLSLRHLRSDRVWERFPNLVLGCAQAGLDLATDLIPVSPAAHYLMGGIATDLDGATSISGLYASGECASTGVHGANRLASNSLLECFVFSHRAVVAGLERPPAGPVASPPPDRPMARAPLSELRRRMWRQAGPARQGHELEQLSAWLERQRPTNPVLVASMIAASALRRAESRGAHLRRDHPDEDPALARRLPCPTLALIR
jgi:L-aspartate oxidase